MSGICGIAAVGSAPPDAATVERMTSWLTRRGPDGRATWHGRHASFGHTLLDTTDAKVADVQPCSLDERCWIVADARIDARAELVAALRAAGEEPPAAASDARLILHAWRAWGEECVARLLGDFAFAIWDEERRSLFCARDHLGVKPFFYSHRGSSFTFASAIDCLRREGGVEERIDELAIADFLLFEMSQEPGATVFAAIRRLPPAHCLTLSAGGMRLRRYWQLPPGELAAPRSDEAWLEQFDAVLECAVADRVRSSRISVLMSGGLDSPALASLGLRRGARVKAFTAVYDRIIPDDERHFSNLAAGFLGIPIAHRACDDYGLFENQQALAHHFPEPVNAPFAAADLDLYADAAVHSRVALTGWDGDAILSESPRPYLATLRRRGQWLRLAAALIRFGCENPARAARSVALRMGGGGRANAEAPAMPGWLNDSFVTRLRLRERWSDASMATPRTDALRPYAHRVFHSLERLGNFFEAVDASRTGASLELRHPFFDLRMIELCLSLPAVPWCLDKGLLRRWLRGRVPEAVRLRPKTPLNGYPHMTAPARPGAFSWRDFSPSERAAGYVDRGKMASMAAEADPGTSWINLRAPALDLWLRHSQPA